MTTKERSRSTAFTEREFTEKPQAGIKPVASLVSPHSVECEQALLACCILSGGEESVTACIEGKIRAEHFYSGANQTIYQALVDLYEERKPIGELVLQERLRARNQLDAVGGIGYLHEIMNRIDTPIHLPYYLQRVRDLALLRQVIQISTRAIDHAYHNQDEVDSFLEQLEQSVFKISEDRISDSARPLKDSLQLAVQMVHGMVENRGKLTGISTGFMDLDKYTSGLHGQEMIVIAARPSMGKTSVALNIAEAAVMAKDKGQRVPTLFFSLEMGAEQLAMRLLCSYARVDMQKLRDGVVSGETLTDVKHASELLAQAPLWIDDSGSLSIMEMRAKARRLHAQRRLGLIIIDYLQLIGSTDAKMPREQQIAEISRGIKAMAKELNVPVIVLAQLNRESEKEKRQPRLSDLRESGSIEQDADLVLLISRKKDASEQDEMNVDRIPRDLIIAKQRNGPVGIVPVMFIKSLTRYENADTREVR